MFKWLSVLPDLFRHSVDLHSSTSADSAAKAKQTWELPAAKPVQWNPAESAAIARCEQQKTICSISGSAYETPVQTVVLGCDSGSNMLLLDEFFPRAAVSPVGGQFQLNLPMGTGLLLLYVIVRSQIQVGGSPAYVAEVISKEAVSDRRLSPRLLFKNASSPRVDLLVALSPRLRGHLMDLSDNGFTMVFYGAAKPKLFTSKGDCRVDFDEHFVLRSKVQILQIRSRRKPFLHTLVRGQFVDLPEAERDRIRVFIRDCVTQSEHLDAA